MTLPVTILGGYLGAGKTTLVNQALRQADGQKLAILVNEFGDLPIDEDLIEAEGDDLISIAGGCICCSFGSDLGAALMQLAEMSPRPDHILIEASGVALPGAIYHTIDVLDGFQVASICVLADASQVRKQARDDYIGDTIHRQLDDADLILLSKTDLPSPSDVDAVQDWLTAAWPAAKVIPMTHGRIPNAILFGPSIPQTKKSNADHHDLNYDSLILSFETPIDPHALADKLTQPEMGLVRAKGCVPTLDGTRALIQIVGPRADITEAPRDMPNGLVCIGPKGRIDTLRLQTLLNEPALAT